MRVEEAISVLDEVIPPPDSYLVDLEHSRIASAWFVCKQALLNDVRNCSSKMKEIKNDK